MYNGSLDLVYLIAVLLIHHILLAVSMMKSALLLGCSSLYCMFGLCLLIGAMAEM